MKGFFSRVMKLIRGEGTVPRYGVEVRESEADFGVEQVLSKSQATSLTKLVALLARELGPERAREMSSEASQAFDQGSDVPTAFASGTNLDVDFALSMYLDWKGVEEMDWEVNKIFETLGRPDRWDWKPDVGGISMPKAFQELEQWLSVRGYHLWHVETDGDDALAFPVRAQDAALAERLANQAGITLFTLENSERYYGPISH